MLNTPRSRRLLVRLAVIAVAAVVLSFTAYQIHQAVLLARLSETEKKIVGAWSWTYLEGVGRMIFTADHRVKEGFPPLDPNRPAIHDNDFTYSLSGTWRVEGDVLVTEIDNHLLLEMFSHRTLLQIVLFLPPNSYKPEFEKKIRRDRIVRLDLEKMLFDDGHSLDRIRR
jgi:hypothetical protein